MFVHNQPALVINKTLVIADLHIGITGDLYKSGISIPSQVKKMAEIINKMKKKTGAKNLIILGDIKHKVPGTSWTESKEIPDFLSQLKFKNIIIVKGNHDGLIEKMVNKTVKVKKFVIVDNYFLTHGHRNIKTKQKTIVIGHNHPHVKFIDEMGGRFTEPVWLIGKLKGGKKIIVMPAFNELSGAIVVNEQPMIGPIAKCILKKQTHAFLLDGTDLGTLDDLKIKDG